MDVGVFPGNYHDYESDEMAIQRTKEIVRDLPDKSCSWEDPSFPHGKQLILSIIYAISSHCSILVENNTWLLPDRCSVPVL